MCIRDRQCLSLHHTLICGFILVIQNVAPKHACTHTHTHTEVVGAAVSVLIIWVITGVLFYEAVLRVLHPDRYEVDADIMLITACIGVYVNVL